MTNQPTRNPHAQAPRQRPEAKPETLHVAPVSSGLPTRIGRPRKLKAPPPPAFEMSAFEQTWYQYFLDAHLEEYPDLTNTDRILLMLAACEFVKYIRIVQNELSTGELITMARQHSGTQMRALLDMLSVTRKARQGGKGGEEDPVLKQAREALMGLSA